MSTGTFVRFSDQVTGATYNAIVLGTSMSSSGGVDIYVPAFDAGWDRGWLEDLCGFVFDVPSNRLSVVT